MGLWFIRPPSAHVAFVCFQTALGESVGLVVFPDLRPLGWGLIPSWWLALGMRLRRTAWMAAS